MSAGPDDAVYAGYPMSIERQKKKGKEGRVSASGKLM
jgi:hypothetical protein